MPPSLLERGLGGEVIVDRSRKPLSLEYNYEKRFATRSSDSKRWNKNIKTIREQAVLRGVDFGPGSFGVALAPDFVASLSVLDTDTYNWLKELPARYQAEVIDMDFTNPESISILNSIYSPEELVRFLNPYLKIIENDNYQISKADKYFKPIDRPVRTNKKVREELFERIHKIDISMEEIPEKELVTIVFEKNKEQDISQMTKKQIISKIVSSKQVNEFITEIDSMELRDKGYVFRQPLEIKGSFNGQFYQIKEEITGQEGEGNTSEEAVKKLKERMLRKYDLLKGMIADFRTPEQTAEFDKYKEIVIDNQL